MNEWKVTGILTRDAVKVETEGDQTINFTIVNSEKPKDAQGNYLRPIKTYVDCQWIMPDLSMLPKLTEGALVYMKGKPYIRPFKRSSDNSEGIAQAMTVTEVFYKKHITPASSPEERYWEGGGSR